MSDTISRIVQDELHHVHRIQGFYINGILNKVTVQQGQGRGLVHLSENFGKFNDKIKKWLIFDLSNRREYRNDVDYFVVFQRATPRRLDRHRQVGGRLFPSPRRPYLCDGFEFVLNTAGIIPQYTEPSTNYLEELEAMVRATGVPVTYAAVIAQHDALRANPGVLQFDDAIAALTPGNFANRQVVLLREHLINNRFAHNGQGPDLDAFIARMNINNYLVLQMLHSILHIYDALYMYRTTSDEFDAHIDILEEYDRLLGEGQQKVCFFTLLDQNAGDFLVRDGGRYRLPYAIAPEAMADKQRQYGPIADHHTLVPSLIASLKGRPLAPTGVTDALPNTAGMRPS